MRRQCLDVCMCVLWYSAAYCHRGSSQLIMSAQSANCSVILKMCIRIKKEMQAGRRVLF